MPEGSVTEVERFARIYVDNPAQLPKSADKFHDPEDGYYFRLYLDGVDAKSAGDMVRKATEKFDVELVRRVYRDGLLKERVYIDSPQEAPDGYKVEQGPAGGLYYETGVGSVATDDSSETRDVAVIHWDDVELGDEIVYETPEGKETFAEIVDIEEQNGEADVVHVDVDGDRQRALPGTYSVENGTEKSEGSDGGATHSARYSPDLPDVCRLCDNDRKPGSMVCEECADDVEKLEKGEHGQIGGADYYCDTHVATFEPSEVENNDGCCPWCDETVDLEKIDDEYGDRDFVTDLYWVMGDADEEGFDSPLRGIAVDFPNHEVYVDWYNSIFPDELEDPHVSIYGSIDDLEQATGNRTQYIADIVPPKLSKAIAEKAFKRLEKDCGGHHKDGDQVRCDETGETYQPDHIEANNEVCPGCDEEMNVVEIMTEGPAEGVSSPDLHNIGKNEDVWVYHVGPEGGEGWMNVVTGEKRYQKQRPGQAPEGGDGYGDWLGDGWQEPPEDLTRLQEGQIVEFQTEDGEYHEGEVDILDPDGEYAKIDGEDVNAIVGSAGDDELTAVEEVEMPTAFDEGEQVHLMTEDLPEDHPAYMDEPAQIGDVTVIDGDAYYEVEDENGTLINEYAEDELEDLVLDGTGGDDDDGGVLDQIEDEFEDLAPDDDDEPEDDETDVSLDDFSEGDQIMYEDEDGYQQTGVIDMLMGDYASLEDGVYVGEDPDNVGTILDGVITGPEPVDGSDDGLDEGESVQIDWDDEMVGDEAFDAEVEYTDGELGFRIQGGPYDGAWVSSDNADVIEDATPDAEPGDMIEVESSVGTFEAEVVDVQGDDYIVDDGDGEFEVFEEDIVDVAEGSDDEPSSFADQLEGEDPDEMTPEEQEFLDEHDIEPGATFMENGLETIVTGADSMMQDGSPSHVEVYVPESDVTTMLHPNSVPDHATTASDEEPDEAEGQTPSEDAMDSAVAESPSAETESDGYDLAEYSPDDVEEYRDMSDIGANHGNSVAAMDVAILPDGSKMVEKDVNHHSVTQDDIEREVAGYHAAKHLDDNVPIHVADVSEGWAASEVVPGVDAKDATPEMKEAVSEEDFVEMAATQVILGNSDLHQNNVRVDENGELYPFDLDRAAGDVQGDWVGNLSQYDDTLDRILGELESAATALDISLDRQAVIEQAEQQANDIGYETVEQIRDDVGEVNEEFAETIADNIFALGNGNVSL